MAEEAGDQQVKISRRRYFSGATLEQAVVSAACEHGIASSEVAYHQVEKRHGFLRTPKKILIEVDPESPRRKTELTAGDGLPLGTDYLGNAVPGIGASGEAGRRRDPKLADTEQTRKQPSLHREEGERSHSPRVAIERLLAVSGLQLSFEVKETVSADRPAIAIDLTGPDVELVLREQGKALYALEHLVPRVMRGSNESRVLCEVDCQRFKAARSRELESIARCAAEEVLATGRGRTLELLNPAERRVVHLTLAQVAGIKTHSEGDGYLKYLTISPMSGPQRRPGEEF